CSGLFRRIKNLRQISIVTLQSVLAWLMHFFRGKGDQTMSKLVKRTIAIMIVCEFLICLGLSLIFPVMPFIKNEYHFSAFDMGVMSALFALVQFVASPVVGRWSDRLGRKPMLIWG